jgi:hypothetical protein
MMNRRAFLETSVAALAGSGLTEASAAANPTVDRVLYNGIRLPEPWPPMQEVLTSEPMRVPYLQAPPAVIPIDLGRQLLVDDFLIAHTTLRRTYHRAQYHPASPVVRPDRPWEQTGNSPMAMVFSDGVWHDPRDRLFKMWYMGGQLRSTCLATSRDGIRWEKPSRDVQAGSNVVQSGGRDSATVWLDLEDANPERRFKLWRAIRHQGQWALALHFSADGVHWSDRPIVSGPCGDRSTVFYNPFRRIWVYSLRSMPQVRTRLYHEHADPVAGARWRLGERGDPRDPVPWVGADRLDAARADLRVPTQLYNLDAVAYESLLLGLFSIWRGQPTDRPKPNEVVLGFSRDGFHWHRPERSAFVPVSERHGDWNWGNVQSAGGGCLIVGEQLYFYVSGRAGLRGRPDSGVSSTGLATLRRDGFASLDAGPEGGTLTTRLVRFRGRRLFVNVAAPAGELRVEVLDDRDQPIAPFVRGNCVAIRADRTTQPVHWRGSADLAAAAGRAVRFRFHLTSGRLYAFWVSPDATGASQGYVAAGGPGFSGPTDAVTDRSSS